MDPTDLEVTLHQHMPLFHMEHCLFCAFLSDGHDHTDCGRPCEQHDVKLRDRSGVDHPLRADLGAATPSSMEQRRPGGGSASAS